MLFLVVGRVIQREFPPYDLVYPPMPARIQNPNGIGLRGLGL